MTERNILPDNAEMILGTPTGAAAELEDITDDLNQITQDAEALAEHYPDRNISWLRQMPKPLSDGSILYLYFTVGRLDDNYASIIQEIPTADGGRRIIERRWSNTSPADKSLQIVRGTRIRPDRDNINDRRTGFNPKDITRLKKLIELLREEGLSG